MKAIIFDLFETLITEWGHEKYTKRKMAEDLKIPYPLLKQEMESFHLSMYKGEIDFRGALNTILSRNNITLDPIELQKVLQKRTQNKRACFESIRSDILEMLQNLKTKGLKIGLITNCSWEEIEGLRSCSIYPYLDYAVLSCEVGLVKPETAIYDLCCNALGVAPGDALFVGDGGSHELEGALNAGLKPVQAGWFIKEHDPERINQQGFEVAYDPGKVGALC